MLCVFSQTDLSCTVQRELATREASLKHIYDNSEEVKTINFPKLIMTSIYMCMLGAYGINRVGVRRRATFEQVIHICNFNARIWLDLLRSYEKSQPMSQVLSHYYDCIRSI